MALEYPEYRESARKVKIVETSADAYYGKGYQDVQNRVPRSTTRCAELGWSPQVGMRDALHYDLRRLPRPRRGARAALVE